MATYSRTLRRGLPRVAGGEAWPVSTEVPEHVLATISDTPAPAEAAPASVPEPVAEPLPAPEIAASAADPASAQPAAETVAEPPAPAPVAQAADVPLRRGLPRVAGGDPWPPEALAPAPAAATSNVSLRRGLPRVPGGEPWPPEGTAAVPAPAAEASLPVILREHSESQNLVGGDTATPASPPRSMTETTESAPTTAPAAQPAATPTREVIGESETPLRRGLPRVAGGDPWPPAGFAPLLTEPVVAAAAAPAAPAAPEAAPSAEPAAPVAQPAAEPPAQTPVAAPQPAEEKPAAPAKAERPAPKPASEKPAKPEKSKREPIMIRDRALSQWAKLVALWGGGIVVAAGIIVLAARGVTTLPGVPEFLAKYPGEYHSPADPEPGFPAWARWTHYLNFFFMLLIIRTGLLVRTQQKPDAFFTPKKGGKKISIYLWLHTSIDVLWIFNGAVFVVLLFVTGHWARIVPTSWEVFPNALSSMLQYLTLQWPVEDGWVNYNSLQQLMYFVIVFVAAPLAIVTGLRMSEWWPEKAEKLSKIYPAPVARAIHFPVMLFFVLFILVHVFLVFTTGALKNLNHMYAGTPEVSWFGFWMFVLGLAVAVGAVLAARPLVIAPIASLFGKVSNR